MDLFPEGCRLATIVPDIASHPSMSAVQIIRGTAALPPDIEDQFRQAYGRDMNEDERAFFGLQINNVEKQYAAQQDWIAKVA